MAWERSSSFELFTGSAVMVVVVLELLAIDGKTFAHLFALGAGLMLDRRARRR